MHLKGCLHGVRKRKGGLYDSLLEQLRGKKMCVFENLMRMKLPPHIRTYVFIYDDILDSSVRRPIFVGDIL